MSDRGGRALRYVVSSLDRERAVELAVHALTARIERHGHGSYAGRHEVQGTLLEEWDELKDAVHANSGMAFVNELLDISTVVLFALASSMTVARQEDPAHSLYHAGKCALEALPCVVVGESDGATTLHAGELVRELEEHEDWLRRRAEVLVTAIGTYGANGPLEFDAETVDGIAIELRTVLEELAS